MVELVKAITEHLGLVFGVVASTVAIVLFRPQIREIFVNRLKSNSLYAEQVANALIDCRLTQIYYDSLESGLGTLDRWMGPRRALARGIAWCLMAAIFYAAGLLFIGWAWHGRPSAFGGLTLMPDSRDVADVWRWLAVIALFASWLGALYLARIRERIAHWVNRPIGRWGASFLFSGVAFFVSLAVFYSSDVPLSYSRLAGSALVGIIGAAIGFANSAFIASIIAGSIAMLFATTIFSTAVIFVGAANATAAAIAFAGVLAAGGVSASVTGGVLVFGIGISGLFDSSAPQLGFLLVLFLTVLPFLNALLDWISWVVSRRLAEDLLHSRDAKWWQRLLGFLVHVGADLLAAFVLLLALAAILARVVEGAIWLYSDVIAFGPNAWRDYICAAAKAPLADGFWATSMLLSTLVPTALHLGLLLVIPFVWLLGISSPDWAVRGRHLLEKAPPPEADMPDAERLRAEAQAALDAGGYHVPTLERIASHLLWQRVGYGVAVVAAGFLLWGLIIGIGHVIEPMPWLLLLAATFDPAFANQCLSPVPDIQV